MHFIKVRVAIEESMGPAAIIDINPLSVVCAFYFGNLVVALLAIVLNKIVSHYFDLVPTVSRA